MKRELYIKSEVDRHRLHVLILAPENQPGQWFRSAMG